MSEKWEKEYLELLKNIFSEKVQSAEIEENEGQTMLVLTFDSPFDDGYIALQFTIEHLIENTEQIQILTSLFTNVDEKLIPGIEKVIAKLNEFLTLGNLAIFYEANQVFFNHAFVINRDMDVALATSILGTTLDIITSTVINAMNVLHPLIANEITVEELLKSDLDLIQ